MKTFVEQYTWDEFQLIEDIRRVLRITRIDRFAGNYQPYQIRANESLSQLSFFSNLTKQDVSIDLYLRNLKLDFAIQVWEIAQDLTKKRYFDYLEHNWLRTKAPFKELSFTSKNRQKAEKYFYKMLVETCNDDKIVSSERATFIRHEHVGYDTDDLRLEVILNENKITNEIRDKVYKQYTTDEKNYSFDLKNQRFSFEDIKDFFVYCDNHLLSLLNAEDGQKEITEQEKFLFSSADISDLDGILSAIKQGANINAIDTNGETAFTKVFENFNYELYNEERKFDDKTLIERTILIASKMLELGADIDLFGYDGINALQQVAYSHNPILMKFLLDNGANPNINYFPEDGQEHIKSTVLDTILSDYYVYDDEENLNQCETLLKNAGAKRK
ncbi:MAG: hypothetical protein ACOX7E_00630 [Paludibacter sp.]|jgi:hypothetical protein|nr:hypothetical protein [Bacteroidales bacterium]